MNKIQFLNYDASTRTPRVLELDTQKEYILDLKNLELFNEEKVSVFYQTIMVTDTRKNTSRIIECRFKTLHDIWSFGCEFAITEGISEFTVEIVEPESVPVLQLSLSDTLIELDKDYGPEIKQALANHWLEFKIRHYVDLYTGQELLNQVNLAGKRYYQYLTA